MNKNANLSKRDFGSANSMTSKNIPRQFFVAFDTLDNFFVWFVASTRKTLTLTCIRGSV
jgi:hypothetical protein